MVAIVMLQVLVFMSTCGFAKQSRLVKSGSEIDYWLHKLPFHE